MEGLKLSFHDIKNECGFTLIELLMVVAILGILAAVAIPLLSGLQVRSYNSASLSDIRNFVVSESALYTDHSIFGGTEMVASLSAAEGGLPNSGSLLFNSYESPLTPIISATDHATNAVRAIKITISNGNYLIGGTSGLNDNYVGISKHLKGDITYGVDSDAPLVYVNFAVHGLGDPLNAGTMPEPTNDKDDFAGVENWSRK